MRIKRAVNAVKKRRKIFKLSKGYFGNKSKSYRIARQAVMKSLNYAFIGRRRRKRDFRKLWIARINAAARMNGLSYSKFMFGLSNWHGMYGGMSITFNYDAETNSVVLSGTAGAGGVYA